MLVAVYIVIALGAFLTGLSKGGLGGGLGALVTPLLAMTMPASLAVGLTLPLLMVGDVFAVSAHWQGWDKQIIWGLLPGTILGVVLGSLVMDSLSPLVIQRILGAAAILYVGYRLWAQRRLQVNSANVAPGFWQTPTFGSATGLASTVANAGGPIMTIYLLTKRLTPPMFVATTALYFAILNVLKVPGYLHAHILNAEMFLVVAWSLPLIPLGVWFGKKLDKHIDMDTFEKLILFFLAITGVILLLKN